MNYLWILLWLVLSAFIVGVFAWSTRILFQQKQAWKAFAGKYKLSYVKGKMFSSPVVFGDYEGHRLNIYSEEQMADDNRGTRFRSVVELMRKSDVPFSGALASGHLVPVLEMFDLPQPFRLESQDWSQTYGGRTADIPAMKSYMGRERFENLNRMLRMSRSGFIYVFNPEDVLLRFETGDPLHDPRRLDKLVKAMLEVSEKIKLSEGESVAVSVPPAVQNDSPEAESLPVAKAGKKASSGAKKQKTGGAAGARAKKQKSGPGVDSPKADSQD